MANNFYVIEDYLPITSTDSEPIDVECPTHCTVVISNPACAPETSGIIDPVPTAGSTNAVASGGTYAAINDLRGQAILANVPNVSKDVLLTGAQDTNTYYTKLRSSDLTIQKTDISPSITTNLFVTDTFARFASTNPNKSIAFGLNGSQYGLFYADNATAHSTTIQFVNPTAVNVLNVPNKSGLLATTDDLSPYAKLDGGNTFGVVGGASDNVFNTVVRVNNTLFSKDLYSNISTGKIGIILDSENYNHSNGGSWKRGRLSIYKYDDDANIGWSSAITANKDLNQNGTFSLPNANFGTLARLEDLPKTECGVTVFTGNGTNTVFSFPHGFQAGSQPNSATASYGGNTTFSISVGFTVSWDTVNITITFATAIPSGQSATINWIAVQK